MPRSHTPSSWWKSTRRRHPWISQDGYMYMIRYITVYLAGKSKSFTSFQLAVNNCILTSVICNLESCRLDISGPSGYGVFASYGRNWACMFTVINSFWQRLFGNRFFCWSNFVWRIFRFCWNRFSEETVNCFPFCLFTFRRHVVIQRRKGHVHVYIPETMTDVTHTNVGLKGV